MRHAHKRQVAAGAHAAERLVESRLVAHRFDDAVGRICERAARAGDSAALLVSHGTALRLWTSLRAAAGGGVDPLWVADHPMHNTGITVVDGDPGAGWSLTSWDDGAWDQAVS